jgi:hypothetical protein
MFGGFTWLDLVGVAIALASLVVTVAIFELGRRLSFAQVRARVESLEKKAWEVMTPIRTEGLNSKIIVMNVERYQRGYDGSNEVTWRGLAYEGHEIIEIVHGGVEVLTGRGVIFWRDSTGRPTRKRNKGPEGEALEVGHIPWEWIQDIRPRGDEFDGSPIFFVQFRGPGRVPFNYMTAVERTTVPIGPRGRPWHRPISSLGVVKPSSLRGWTTLLTLRRMDRARRRG